MAKIKASTSGTGSAAGRLSYTDQIARRNALQQRLAVAKEAIADVSSDADSKRRAAHEANNEPERYEKEARNQNRSQGRGSDPLDGFQQERLEQLTKEATEADKAADEASARFQALSKEINDLECDLGSFDYVMGTDEVLSFQQDQAAAEKKVDDLKEHIARQLAIIKAAQADIQSATDRIGEREDLMAEIAVRKASEKDLRTLDELIEKENKIAVESQAQANKIIEPARQSIAGLKRKLEEAERALEGVKAKHDEVMFQYLMTRAEHIGEEYVALSMQLVDAFKQLVALDQIMGYPSRLRVPCSDGFAIPIFRLRAFSGLERNGYYGQIAAARGVMDNIQTVVDEMKSMFHAAGVNL